MSASPAHAGHFKLIELAAAENDHVLLYVSLSDRARKGEVTITGADKGVIWRQYLEPALPDNVEVEYGGSPVRKVYEQLGSESERLASGDDDVATYTVYSDPADLDANFPVRSMERYAPAAWEAGIVDRRAVGRGTTVDVSGTKMRQMLSQGDEEGFTRMLPDALDDEAHAAIWRLLRTRVG